MPCVKFESLSDLASYHYALYVVFYVYSMRLALIWLTFYAVAILSVSCRAAVTRIYSLNEIFHLPLECKSSQD